MKTTRDRAAIAKVFAEIRQTKSISLIVWTSWRIREIESYALSKFQPPTTLGDLQNIEKRFGKKIFCFRQKKKLSSSSMDHRTSKLGARHGQHFKKYSFRSNFWKNVFETGGSYVFTGGRFAPPCKHMTKIPTLQVTKKIALPSRLNECLHGHQVKRAVSEKIFNPMLKGLPT